MSLSILSHFSAIFSIVIILFIIWQLCQIKFQLRQNASKSLFIALGSIALWVVMTHIALYLSDIGGSDTTISSIGFFSNLLVLGGLFFLTLFSRYHISSQLHLLKYGVLLGMIGIIVGLRLVVVFVTYEKLNDLETNVMIVVSVLNGLILLVSLGYIIGDFKLVLKENLNKDQKTQVRFVLFGIITGVGGMIPINLLTIFYGQKYMPISYLIISLSMVLTSYGYYKDPRICFLIPDKANLVLIINSAGTLKYYQAFSPEYRRESDNYLISAALSAIRHVMSEFYRHEVHPTSLTLQSQFIQFKSHNEYIIAVFSKYQSKLIDFALEETSHQLSQRYQSALSSEMQNGLLLDVEDIITDTFYFAFPQILRSMEN